MLGCNSITAKHKTYGLLLKKLRGWCGLFLVTLRKFFDDAHRKNVQAVRHQIIKIMQTRWYQDQFREVMQLQDQLFATIYQSVVAAINLSCRPDLFAVDESPDVCEELFRFLLRTCNEHPIILMQDDDAQGTHVTFLQDSMENFIAESLRVTGGGSGSSEAEIKK
jgi:hypothetical protein